RGPATDRCRRARGNRTRSCATRATHTPARGRADRGGRTRCAARTSRARARTFPRTARPPADRRRRRAARCRRSSGSRSPRTRRAATATRLPSLERQDPCFTADVDAERLRYVGADRTALPGAPLVGSELCAEEWRRIRLYG